MSDGENADLCVGSWGRILRSADDRENRRIDARRGVQVSILDS